MRFCFCLTWFLLLSASLLQAAPCIVILRGQHRQGAPAQGELSTRAQHLASLFEEAQVDTQTLAETDLTLAALRGAKLLILPYNPTLQPAQLDVIEAFVRQRGKLMAFYNSNPRILKLLGLGPSAFITGKQFGKPATVECLRGNIPGLPKVFPQASWNGIHLKPVGGATTVVGRYLNSSGKPTGYPAITGHPHGFAFAHILLSHKDQRVSQALLGLAATAVPSIWKQTTMRLLQDTGNIGGARNLEQLAQLIPPEKRSAFAGQLQGIRQCEKLARTYASKQNYRLALPYAQKAHQDARTVYLLSRSSKPGELRGAWIHSAYGIEDWGWDRTIQVLKAGGFNAVFPNMLWGYVADFNSTVLPVHPDVKTKGDQLKLCLEACRKYGVECHVWKVCWNMGYRTPKHLKAFMTRNQRTQVTRSGGSSSFLAPHLPANQRLEINALVDLVKRYPVDGVHLDYIRYPDGQCDFSPSARTYFERHLGQRVKRWPSDCIGNGPHAKQYQRWRRGNINRTVQAIHQRIHDINPKVKVSAAVYGGWDNATRSIAQDAKTWIDQGWIDFLCPMNYFSDRESFVQLTAQQLAVNHARIPIYPGIGSYLTADPAAVAEQIEATRELGADGFLCFKLDRKFAMETLPQLAKSITATQALPPFPHHSPPLMTRLAKSKVPALEGVFAFPEQVTAHMTFPPHFRLPNQLNVRLLRNGHYLPSAYLKLAARRKGQLVACAFLPPAPGTYRIEVSDNRTFASTTHTFKILSPEEVRTTLIREGLPQFAKDGRPRIAVWQDRAYGGTSIMASLKGSKLFDLAPLYNLKPDTLNACHAVIIPQPRRNAELFHNPETAQRLHDYIRRGGAVLVTHALVGIRGFPVICPHVIASAGESPLNTNLWMPNPQHPIARRLPQRRYASTFTDMIGMTPGPTASPIAYDRSGQRPVALAGSCGKGRFVAIGLGWGITRGDKDTPLTPADRLLLLNSVTWMLTR